MGGGASTMQEVEEVIAATYLIGRALANVATPDMFRLEDFHSSRAPPLKSRASSSPFGLVEYTYGDGVVQVREIDAEQLLQNQQEYQRLEDAEAGGTTAGPDPADYEDMFSVEVSGRRVYLEGPLDEPNEQGWTPLHACCHSYTTVVPGTLILEEMVRQNADLDVRTRRGPGAFNSGWTALHMASAYGVQPLVQKLVAAGADVNTTDSSGWTPLQEAVHRGFAGITKVLVEGGANVNTIPPQSEVRSPFVRSPTQSPLGEAVRYGFRPIVKYLLDHGADKNLQNSHGWTPLHEAAFANQGDTVRMLLVYGADASLRTKKGALAFHLTNAFTVKEIIKELGGEHSMPEPDEDADYRMMEIQRFSERDTEMQEQQAKARQEEMNARRERLRQQQAAERRLAAANRTPVRGAGDGGGDDHSKDDANQPLLHSGGVLGDLPALTPSSGSRGGGAGPGGAGPGGAGPGGVGASGGRSYNTPEAKADRDEMSRLIDADSINPASVSRSSPVQLPQQQRSPATTSSPPSTMAQTRQHHHNDHHPHQPPQGELPGDERLARAGAIPAPPPDTPSEFLCDISNRVMHTPVRTPYGHVFERNTIMLWFKRAGHVCPITGQPLAESELQLDEALAQRIQTWQQNTARIERGTPADSAAADRTAPGKNCASPSTRYDDGIQSVSRSPRLDENRDTVGGDGGAEEDDDDMYDF